jgi:hypothetical protein
LEAHRAQDPDSTPGPGKMAHHISHSFSSHSMFVTSTSTFYGSEVKAQWCK